MKGQTSGNSKKVKAAKIGGKVQNKRNKPFVKQMSVADLQTALVTASGTQANKITNELSRRA